MQNTAGPLARPTHWTFESDDGIVVVEELAERVARLEGRFDGVTVAIADLKEAVSKLDAHMGAGFAELRSEFSTLRGDMGRELSAIRGEFGGELSGVRGQFGGEFSAIRGELSGIRAEMSTQFRWIMGGIGSAALAILVAVLAAVLANG